MRARWKMSAVISALLIGAPAADATTAQCVDCNDEQMVNKARTLGASSSAHIVWNPVNGSIKRFRNYCGSAPSNTDPGMSKPKRDVTANTNCTLQSEELAVSSDLTVVAGALSQIWQQSGGTFKAQIEANVFGLSYPAHLPHKPSAHDFQNDLQLQRDILRMASTPQIFQLSNTPLAGSVTQVLAHVDAFLAMTQGVFVSVDIVFADGSRITVMVKLNENATYVANSAEDSTGHAIPDYNSSNRYPGNWYFPPGQAPDMAAFIEYLRQLGVTIAGGSANGGVINCTWNSTNNTTTCVVPN
jgi:hypothetical protein